MTPARIENDPNNNTVKNKYFLFILDHKVSLFPFFSFFKFIFESHIFKGTFGYITVITALKVL